MGEKHRRSLQEREESLLDTNPARKQGPWNGVRKETETTRRNRASKDGRREITVGAQTAYEQPSESLHVGPSREGRRKGRWTAREKHEKHTASRKNRSSFSEPFTIKGGERTTPLLEVEKGGDPHAVFFVRQENELVTSRKVPA